MTSPTVKPEPALRRALSYPMLVLYGLGTTIGGGIYVLVGRVAERAGAWAPLSFLVAAGLIAFTALAFAELSARYPESAGEAVYTKHGFGRADLAMAVGFVVILAGLVSSAALAHGFAGYFRGFVEVPAGLVVLFVVMLLGLVAAWGIGESVGAAGFITVVEIGGLLFVIWAGSDALPVLPDLLANAPSLGDMATWGGIVSGSFLAFYAFIGFEDMVNVAEEVKDVERTLPRAIITTLIVTTAIYLAVALVAVASVPLAELGASNAPLLLVVEHRLPEMRAAFGLIGMFAVLNGALIQLVMAARVLYGMAREGWIHPVFGRVHARTQTPLVATAVSAGAILALAFVFPIVTLAEITSLLVLTVASVVNAALLRLKLTGRAHAPATIMLPPWVPAAGLLVSLLAVFLIVRDIASG